MATFRQFVKAAGKVSRQLEREANRRRKELEKRQKEAAKLEDLQRAEYEVEVFENRIEMLLSVHKECSSHIDWEQLVKQSKAPEEPSEDFSKSENARLAYENYTPSRFAKAFGGNSKKARLKEQIDLAVEADRKAIAERLREYEEAKQNHDTITDITSRLRKKDPTVYIDIVNSVAPFEEFGYFGTSVAFEVNSVDTVTATLTARGDDVVPSRAKSLTKTGKLSVRNMPKSRFNELYQDFICGAALRVGRELLAILPVQTVISNVKASLLNSSTGHMEDPIHLVRRTRATNNGFT